MSVADDARYGISEFVSDPALLGPWFSDPSWHNCVVVLKAAFAERMSLAERRTFRQLAERDPPKTRCRELWLGVGRRGGKDSIASCIAVYWISHLSYDQAKGRSCSYLPAIGSKHRSFSGISRPISNTLRCCAIS